MTFAYTELTSEQQNRFNEILTHCLNNSLNALTIQEDDAPVLCSLLDSLWENPQLFHTDGVVLSEEEEHAYIIELDDFLLQSFSQLSGSLKAAECLLTLVKESKSNDIIYGSEYFNVFANYDASVIPLLKQIIEEVADTEEFVSYFCCDAWRVLIQDKPEYHQDFVEFLVAQLQNHQQQDSEFNAFMLNYMIDYPELAVQYIDFIRKLFDSDSIFFGICGDLEDVEMELGLRTERATPKPKYTKPEWDFLFDDETDDSNDLFHFQLNKMEQLLKQNRQQYEVQAKPERVYQTVEVRTEPKIGRNDPCPCGSGKKYKKCCGA